MNSKILLLTIAVISVGLFAMPTTLSLFAGQHTFDKAGNNTICVKCHSDIQTEIQAGTYHRTLLNDTSGDCKGCHTSSYINGTLIPKGNNSGNGTNVNVGLNISGGIFTMANGTNITSYGAGQVHAAVTVECKACHTAVDFTNDAHKSFADNTTTQIWFKGANEACVGCHTKANVGFTWTRKGGYNYTYDFANETGVLTYNNTNVNTTTDNV